MPKRTRTPRQGDFNQVAQRLVKESTHEPPLAKQEKELKRSEISKVMAAMGARGGRKGGKRRAELMTPEQRSQSASLAARARWGKE